MIPEIENNRVPSFMRSTKRLKTRPLEVKTVFTKVSRWAAAGPNIFWLLPICAALLTTRYIFTVIDSDWYLAHAKMIAQGYGFVSEALVPRLNRGPLFFYLIGGVFHFFGIRPELIGYVVRVFYMLDLLVLYAIGKRLYGRTAGFFVFFLALTAFTIHKTSPYILLDFVLPFFILLSVLMMVIAMQAPSAIFPLAAGVSLGLAYLTKETALMYPLMFCLLLFQKRFTIGKRLIRTGTAYLGFGLVTAPWIYHVVKISPSIKAGLVNLIGGGVRLKGASALVQNAGTVSLLDRIGHIVNGIINYNLHTVPKDFAIAPLFLVGFAILFITLLIRRRFSGGEVLITALILTSPLNAYLGHETMRTGQSITYYFLLLAACSAIIGGVSVLAEMWQRKAHVYSKISTVAVKGLPVLLAIVIIFFQIFQEKQFAAAIMGKGTYGFTYYQQPGMELTGHMGAAQFEAAKWIAQHMDQTGKVLISGGIWGAMNLGGVPRDKVRFIWLHPGANNTPLEWTASGGTPSLPFIVINPLDNTERHTLAFQRRLFGPHFSDHDRPLFILTPPALPNVDCLSPKGVLNSNPLYYCGIWFLPENMFLDYLRSADIRYIVLSQNHRFLNEYLKLNKGFRLEVTDERPTGSAYIYRVLEPQPLGGSFRMVGDRVPLFLERLKTYYPDKFERFRQEVLVNWFHLEPDQIHEILSGEGSSFSTY